MGSHSSLLKRGVFKVSALNITLLKSDPAPIYYQIANQLRLAIQGGQLSPGMSLPSERELSSLLDVSRDTVRRAIRDLISEGYCYNEVGKGTIVSHPRTPINIVTPVGTTDFVGKLGLNLWSKVISLQIKNYEQIEPQIIQKMGSKNDRLLVLKRVRYINNKPGFYEESYLPVRRYPGLEHESFEGSLYKILDNRYDVRPSYAKAEIQTKLADIYDLKLLDVPLSHALLIKEAAVFTEDDQIMEFIRSVYPSDRFVFVIDGSKP